MASSEENGNPPAEREENLRELYVKARASLTDEDLRRLAQPDMSADVSLDELIVELEEMVRLAEEKRACG